jgi:hypothetical protein
MLGQLPDVDDPGDPQRAPEGATPTGQREASRVEMHVHTSARQTTGRIGPEAVTSLTADRDNPQQLSGRRALPATHTCAFRRRTSYH